MVFPHSNWKVVQHYNNIIDDWHDFYFYEYFERYIEEKTESLETHINEVHEFCNMKYLMDNSRKRSDNLRKEYCMNCKGNGCIVRNDRK